MSSTPLNAIRTAADPSNPLDPDRLSDQPDPPDPGHAPFLPSDDISSAMDTSGPVDMDLVHVAATSPLASNVVPPVPLSTPSYKDKLLVSGSSGSQPTAADFVDDEEVLMLEVEYESLPTICFECGKYNHVKDICLSSIRVASSPPPVAPMVPVAPSTSEAFGPWMLVERHQRRSSRKATSHTVASPVSSPSPVVAHGSQFNPIFEESLDMAHVSVDTNGPQQQDVVPPNNSDVIPPAIVVAPMPISMSATVDVPAVGSSADAPPTSVVAPPTSKSFVLQTHGKEKSKFNKANHTAVVVDENANLSVHSPTLTHSPAPVSVQANPLIPCVMVSMPKDSGESLPVGCGHPKFVTAVKQYIRDYKPSLIGIVEPRISSARADSVIATLGFHYSHCIEAVGFSGGLWLCWHASIRVDVLVHHFQLMHCRITCLSTGSSSLVTLVYASHSVPRRKALWPHLRSLASSILEPWLLMGDFNATLDASERKGGVDAFVLADNWKPMTSLSETIKAFTAATDIWNATVFGYIGATKRSVIAHLRGAQRALACRRTKAKQRMVRNRITSLQLPDGSWCDDESVLRSEMAKFFRDLFLDNDSNCRASYPFSGCFPTMP
ncbi:hypothetical protein V6N13_124121 [Hibiscus sabdariffa]